ncbi:hypothetical protein [Embleya sp. NPDC020630]|uniref:hypothetical protein n=1 Tax=Embleya sp. NPDC020630 TaxID=3363979 RepID=UPI0037B2CEBC
MPEPHESSNPPVPPLPQPDPLRAALLEVAVDGSRQAAPAPFATIRRRGDRLRRRRMALLGAAACLVLGGTATLATVLIQDDPTPSPPAVSPVPVPSESPVPTPMGTDATPTLYTAPSNRSATDPTG